jgi:UDP-N-acetylmuramate dehydrogenase
MVEGTADGTPADDSALEQAAALLGPRAQRDRPIGPLTTYRVGGRAALALEIEDDDDLTLASRAVGATGLRVLVVGKGSNLLVADGGFPGLVVTLGDTYATIDLAGAEGRPGEIAGRGGRPDVGVRRRVRAGAAVGLPVLARRSAHAGLTGLEWAVGVPGSVGGAARMNAGGHGSETSERLERICFADLSTGEHEIAGVDRLGYSYRHSSVAAHHVVIWAEFAVDIGDAQSSEKEIAEIVRWRRENQPGGQNAGSVFTNPPGDSAGRLIDLAGLKGHRVGSACVSTKHANFFQADPGGSADDVRALIEEVRRLVSERLGVDLETELRLVGFRK